MNTNNSNLFTSTNPTDTVSKVLDEVEQYFPGLSQGIDVGLSVWAELKIKDISLPAGLFFVGNPGGGKTTLINILNDPAETYYLDSFTPAGFVSNVQGKTQSALNEIDLLPKVKDKLLLTPELNVTWNQKKETLAENIGILSRVLDGNGLMKHAGTHGTRGYRGKIMFAWIAATTPMSPHVWLNLAQTGSKLYFYPVETKKHDDKDIVNMLKGKVNYGEKIAKCKSLVSSFMQQIKQKYPQGVEWDTDGDDDELIKQIHWYAKLTAALRGRVDIQYEKDGNYTLSFAKPEDTKRASQWYYNLARGHALIHGRTQIAKEDFAIIEKIAMASAPHDRVKAYKVLSSYKGLVSIDDLAIRMQLTKKATLRICRVLEALGLVEIGPQQSNSPGRPCLMVLPFTNSHLV